MRIDELMKGKKPGEIRITQPNWQKHNYFCPYYREFMGPWYGTSAFGASEIHYGDGDPWTLWEEPVEMEDRWLWSTKSGKISDFLHTISPGIGYTIKLEWSITSFPKEKK